MAMSPEFRHKLAILGETYARALSNAATRNGRALSPAMSGKITQINAQPQARLQPGLGQMFREHATGGALTQTPQISAMQNLAHRLPWAGEEHTTPTMSDKAPARFDRTLQQHGLVHDTPAGQPTAQQRIDEAFGRFGDREQGKTSPATAVGSPRAIRARTPIPSDPLAVPPSGNTFVRPAAPAAPAAASPNRFPRARLQAMKTAGALHTAIGAGIPLALGGAMLAQKPGIQSNLHNLMAGKGSTQEQDIGGEIPDAVQQQAQAIHQHLTSRGLDPRSLRIGIDAPPGSGKTTLARALAHQTGMSHYGLDWEPGNAWKSTIGLGRNVENTPHAPRAGEIIEHYLLNRTHDPELFDAHIHLRRDPSTIRQQLNQRGNAAYISDLMDLDKSLGVADLGFDTLDGEEIDLGNGAAMKLRPREGWGNQLDHGLAASGIDATGLSRHEKLLTLHNGQRTTGAGWKPYVKNPFTSAQTFALGASVPLGILAARALSRAPKLATVKIAIGTKQKNRIQQALSKTKDLKQRERQNPLWGQAQNETRRPGEAGVDPYHAFNPVYEDRNPRAQAYIDSKHEKQLSSGRHSPNDIVHVPFTQEPSAAENSPGVHPGHMAWRGQGFDAPGQRSYIIDTGEGPRWFSGLPNVSAGYAKRTGSRIDGFRLSDVPDANQGPWTQHIAKDPRENPKTRYVSKTPVGDSHLYEKVIDAEAIPEPFVSYKKLPSPDKFQRVRGPNLLGGEPLPPHVPPHIPTINALRKDAPALATRLLGDIAKHPPKIAMEKTAIGKRQTEKMRQALLAMGYDDTARTRARLLHDPNYTYGSGWLEAHSALTGRDAPWARPGNPLHTDFKDHFSPVYEDPSAVTKRQRRDRIPPWERSNEIAHSKNLDAILTSGRHDKSDIVQVPFSDHPDGVHKLPGVHPDRIAWRGGGDLKPNETGPRWFSGVPNVSVGYITPGDPPLRARATQSGKLTAHELSKTPDANQGPWTQHIAQDPRGKSNALPRNAGKSDVGTSPIYEKVIDAEHIAQPLSTYRPLITPGHFIREQGLNVLRNGLPESVVPHEPIRAALQKSAPGLAAKLRNAGAILKKVPR